MTVVDALTSFSYLPLAVLVVALGATWLALTAARAKLGSVAAEHSPARAWRLAGFIVPQLVFLVLIIVRGELPLVPWALLPLVGIALAVVLPGFNDAACGEDGVRRGFDTRTWSELEEWRITGEHLRFRLFGEWTSAPLPAADQARIRAKLLATVPERESRFQD